MITFRPAKLEDAPLLRYWDTKQHVIDCDPDSDWHWEKELKYDPPWREQLVAELFGQPIGFVQIIDPYEEESHYWGAVEKNLRAIDIWIGEEENLGQGFGTVMMNMALQKCFSSPEVTRILIDPLKTNVKAHRFYERLGFEFLDERTFDDADCYVYELRREKYVLLLKQNTTPE